MRSGRCPIHFSERRWSRRWSGARRNEVRRLTTDCLDSYADGTARLRIPVGKTARERMIPLHDEAVDALRTVLAMRARTLLIGTYLMSGPASWFGLSSYGAAS